MAQRNRPEATGRAGGLRAAAAMTAEERSERARAAALARWRENGIQIPPHVYRGPGRCWVALSAAGEIVGIRMMGDHPAISLGDLGRKRMAVAAVYARQRAEQEKFLAWRDQARAELAAMGEVVSGISSGGAFWPRSEEVLLRLRAWSTQFD